MPKVDETSGAQSATATMKLYDLKKSGSYGEDFTSISATTQMASYANELTFSKEKNPSTQEIDEKSKQLEQFASMADVEGI